MGRLWCEKFIFKSSSVIKKVSPMAQKIKNANNAGGTGDAGLIPGSERSPGEGNGNSPQCCCFKNPIDRETWWAVSMESQIVRHDLVTVGVIWFLRLQCGKRSY